jgi:type VI secretion system protein ImpM
VPQPVADPRGLAAFPEVLVGFHGKIPARGDFVQSGLPRRFVEPWDAWMQRGLTASRAELGAAWLPAWLEAPVWRFALPAGPCGPHAALGLWLPSVDRVGRYFPLTLAALVPDADPAALIAAGGGFLAAAEEAGRAALADDLAPEALALRLAAAREAARAEAGIAMSRCPLAGALWWTEGGPRVPAGAFATAALPEAAAFAAMIDAGTAAARFGGPPR